MLSVLSIHKVNPVFQQNLIKSFFPFLGKDATEAFEDIGHSDEAREILEKYYVADLDEAVSARYFIRNRIQRRILT